MKRLSLIASALAVLGLTACEKGLVEDIADVGNGQVKNSVLQVRTRAGGSVADAATVSYPVTVYVFQDEDCRAEQTIGDEGQMLNIPLVEGAYSVLAIGGASVDDNVLPDASDALTSLVIAHNGEGSATITSTEKVTFPNNKVTDTFYYYGDLIVTSEVQSYDLTLTRAVAMFRLVLTDDEIPSTVTKFKFYYTGGSSTFSPSAGYGCVNSKQTEIRAVADGVTTFDIFTLPHTEDDVLTETI